LGNIQAQAYYKQHRSWKGTPRKRASAIAPSFHLEHIKPDRDLAHAGQRYMQMSKAALVDRLLAVEQAYAERQERWLVQQDELLRWRLRAEQAEARLQRERQRRRRNTGKQAMNYHFIAWPASGSCERAYLQTMVKNNTIPTQA
jgi:hypothetical protein